MMKVIVCVKQVPDTAAVKIDPVSGTMIRSGIPLMMNPDDLHAVEAGLVIRDQFPGSEITAITMGPAQAEQVLRQCLALGADQAILLCDPHFAGADTWATARTLAAAIKNCGGADLILTGKQAIDGDTGQVGPEIAQHLGIPQITCVQKIALHDHVLYAHRKISGGYQVMESSMPCLLTVEKELNTVRYMTVRQILAAFEKKITVWGLKEIGLAENLTGLKGSATRVLRTFVPQQKKKTEMLSGSAKQSVSILLQQLRKRHIL